MNVDLTNNVNRIPILKLLAKRENLIAEIKYNGKYVPGHRRKLDRLVNRIEELYQKGLV